MKKLFLYKKWNILILLNNLMLTGFFIYTKKIIFLQYDTSKHFFWKYSKKVKFQNKWVINLKKKFGWLSDN